MVIEKDCEAVMVECKDNIVTENSLVCISPYNLKTGEWKMGLMELLSMSDVMKMKCKKVSKDRNVEEFFEKTTTEVQEK